MTRRQLIAMLGGIASWPIASHAQQPTKVPRIGLLSPGDSALPDSTVATLDGFLQGLHDLGYVDGQNIAVERRYGEWKPDRLRQGAADLVAGGVDVLAAFSTPAARAAKQATSTIPIVGFGMADPVADGLVDSLARPGGNLKPTKFELVLNLKAAKELGLTISREFQLLADEVIE